MLWLCGGTLTALTDIMSAQQHMPAATCLLLQDMCIVLELRDATLLVPSLKKVAAVAAAIPSVEAFVAQVNTAGLLLLLLLRNPSRPLMMRMSYP
jgi:hypothetical protein